MKLSYQGMYMSDSNLEGHRKRDGVIPGVTSVIQLSKDRFGVFYVPHMMGVWDMNTTINYQVRAESPMGPVLSEDIAMEEEPDWRPFDIPLYRCPGLSFAFGVPRGAKLANGTPFPNENVFVLQTYLNPQLHWNGEIMLPHGARVGKYPNWPEHIRIEELTDRLPRIFARHFRLNDAGDDLEFLTSWEMIHEDGYDAGFDKPFCRFGETCNAMSSAFTPPLPVNENCDTWLEIATFKFPSPDAPYGAQCGLAAVEYAWDGERQRYRWTNTGEPTRIEGVQLTEAGLVRMDDGWVVTARSNRADTCTRWFRTAEPLQGLGAPSLSDIEGNVPRMPFRFADGGLRIVFPDERWVPLAPGEPVPMIAYDPKRGKYSRDPLTVHDVDPVTFTYSSRRVLLDVVDTGISVVTPATDHATLTPNVGNRQWLLFRIKDRDALRQGTPEERLQGTGIHCVEVGFDGPVSSMWRF